MIRPEIEHELEFLALEVPGDQETFGAVVYIGTAPHRRLIGFGPTGAEDVSALLPARAIHIGERTGG